MSCLVLLQPCHLFLPWLCGGVLQLQLAQGTRCMGPEHLLLPMGTWHTPCAGLGTTVLICGQESRSFTHQPCPLHNIWGFSLVKQQPWQGTAKQEWGHPIFPAPNCKQAPGPDSTSALDLLNGACRATRDGSGWDCGQD